MSVVGPALGPGSRCALARDTRPFPGRARSCAREPGSRATRRASPNAELRESCRWVPGLPRPGAGVARDTMFLGFDVNFHDVREPAVPADLGQHFPFPRRARPGFGGVLRPPRLRGAAERRQALLSVLSRLRSATRTLRSVRAPTGAPPWRFFDAGPRFRPRHCLRRSVQRAPRGAGRSARRSASAPPEPAVASRSRGTPISLRLRDRL